MSADVIHFWSEIAIIVQAFIALIAASFTYVTIDLSRKENRRWNTLNICAQYELNENLVKANDMIYEAFYQGKILNEEDRRSLERPAIIILNYLDGIAIGVSQGLFIEELAKDHLKTIVNKNVHNLLESKFFRAKGLTRKIGSF